MTKPSLRSSARPGLRIRLILGPGSMFGPGKAQLLAAIAETGSIAAAGRRMRMSYKRAWSLVEELNALWREPLVETARGGAGRGGAKLTPTGERVLEAFRRIEAKAEEATAAEVAELRAALREAPETR